jgi:hypothetical protein
MPILQRATVVRLVLNGTLAWGLGGGLALPAAATDLAATGLMEASTPLGNELQKDVSYPFESERAAPASEPDGSPAIIPSPGTRTSLWRASVECLYAPGEPRALSPCIPPPPCHPSHPPMPYDLIGVAGMPSGGPIYRGPCEPRTGTHDHLHFWRLHRLRDRFFDWFYTAK